MRKSNISMIRMPDTHRLLIEGADGHSWVFTPPAGWEWLRTSGATLAFFERADGLRVGVNAFLWTKDDGDEEVWIHASCSRGDRLPSYEDLCDLHKAVFGDGFSAQVFVPESLHVNIHPFCLHLWGPLDPKHWPLPILGQEGTI